MVFGLANANAARIPLTRAEKPFTSIEGLWRRAKIPASALEHLADAYGSLGINRRDALWTIRGLSDEVMTLFGASGERDGRIRPETAEPAATLTPMTEGREVVEDYRSQGLTLRQGLAQRRIIPAPTSGMSEMVSGRRWRDWFWCVKSRAQPRA